MRTKGVKTNQKVLLFGFSDEAGTVTAAGLRRRLRGLGITAERIEKAEYLKPLGALAGIGTAGMRGSGLSGMIPAQKKYTGPELPARMLVMSGIAEDELDQILKTFRECGISGDDLKAVLTPVNASWNAVGLCHELLTEHRQMTGKHV